MKRRPIKGEIIGLAMNSVAPEEIARAVKASVNTVKSTISRARRNGATIPYQREAVRDDNPMPRVYKLGSVDRYTLQKMHSAASKLGMSADQLASELLVVIIRDAICGRLPRPAQNACAGFG
jgi:hypothetical protein